MVDATDGEKRARDDDEKIQLKKGGKRRQEMKHRNTAEKNQARLCE